MTIIEESNRSDKSREGSNNRNNSSSNSVQTEELLPSYSIEQEQRQLQQQQSQQFQQSFNTERISTLNPEASKKLARESRENDLNELDYGFESNNLNSDGLAPPSFADGDIRPTYFISGSGNLVSHDEVLNSSPTALARFLRLHCTSPPAIEVQLRGSHQETRSSTHHETASDGSMRSITKTHEVEVEDFQFNINASKEVEVGLGKSRGGSMRGLIYSARTWESGASGNSWLNITANEARGSIRLPNEEDEAEEEFRIGNWNFTGFWQRRKLENERRARLDKGLPGFVSPAYLHEMSDNTTFEASNQSYPGLLLQSHFLDLVENHASVPFALTGVTSPNDFTLVAERDARESEVTKIIESYCASTSILKELTVEKELYGWNWDLLEAGIRSTLRDCRYIGKVQIKFKIAPTSIVIRPMNPLSQIFSLPIWVKVILWILLVYPVLLIINCIYGDQYNLNVAFPLTRWRLLPIPASSSSSLTYDQALTIAKPLTSRTIPKVAQLPINGDFVYLIGTEEGAWLKAWENGIIDAVRRGRRGGELSEADRVPEDGRDQLRGYAE